MKLNIHKQNRMEIAITWWSAISW